MAALEVEALYGGFAGEPFTDDSHEYVFVTSRGGAGRCGGRGLAGQVRSPGTWGWGGAALGAGLGGGGGFLGGFLGAGGLAA